MIIEDILKILFNREWYLSIRLNMSTSVSLHSAKYSAALPDIFFSIYGIIFVTSALKS
jgi:hypothetical protein